MPRQYLLPGGGVINETANGRSYFIPNWGLITETSGTDFNDSLTESVTAASAVSNAAVFPNTLTESVTLTDSVIGGFGYSDSFTEIVTTADTASVIKSFTDALPSSVTLADSATIGKSSNVSFTESINLDGVTTVQVFYSAQVGFAAYGRCEYGDVGIVSSPVVQFDVPGSSYILVSVAVHAAITETLTATDAIAVGLSYLDTVSAGITASDALKLLSNFRDQSVKHLVGGRLIVAKLNGSI